MAAYASPGSSTAPAAAVVAFVFLLAALDLIGSVLAKEWGISRSPWFFGLGALSFVALFALYGSALKIAEMSTVTFGWIVLVQVAVLVLERVRYDVSLPPGKWIAVVGICLLQGYLILAPAAPTS